MPTPGIPRPGAPRPGARDPVGRARRLLDDARAAEATVEATAATLFRLGGDIARAGTRGEAADSGAAVAAARDEVARVLTGLDEVTAGADALEAEPGDPGSDTREILVAVRGVVRAASIRGRECVWMGELAAARVHDLAEFELLHSRAVDHLDRGDPAAADEVVPRLVELDRALVSEQTSAQLDELRFRLITTRE